MFAYSRPKRNSRNLKLSSIESSRYRKVSSNPILNLTSVIFAVAVSAFVGLKLDDIRNQKNLEVKSEGTDRAMLSSGSLDLSPDKVRDLSPFLSPDWLPDKSFVTNSKAENDARLGLNILGLSQSSEFSLRSFYGEFRLPTDSSIFELWFSGKQAASYILLITNKFVSLDYLVDGTDRIRVKKADLNLVDNSEIKLEVDFLRSVITLNSNGLELKLPDKLDLKGEIGIRTALTLRDIRRITLTGLDKNQINTEVTVGK